MIRLIVTFCLVFLFAGLNNRVCSVPAYPLPLKYRQPDGSEITVLLRGDERVSWAETTDGYTLLRNKLDGWEYAQLNRIGDLEKSGLLAHETDERTILEHNFADDIPKQLKFSAKQFDKVNRDFDLQLKSAMSTNAFVPLGSKKLLMILMNFSDKSFVHSSVTFSNLMNQSGYNLNGAIGSVNDYFKETSYNQFDITTTIVGPYTAKNTLDYYGTNTPSKDYKINELIIEALNLANPDVNFTDYDNDSDGSVDGVYVVYAGYNEASGGPSNTIWPKAGSVSTQVMDGKTIRSYSCSSELRGNSGENLTTIGVICHEFGHVCGARDYYDTDYETGGSFTGSGSWDLMAGGTWNGSPGGSCPPHFNPKIKADFKWLTPVILNSNATVKVEDITRNKSVYIYNTTTPNEYFILENRQKTGFNAAIPGQGLLIYHYSKFYFDNNSYRNKTFPQGFYPVCASATTVPGSTPASYGSINSDGCTFPGRQKKTSFTDITIPNSKSWNSENTDSEITNITEIGGNIFFCFKGCTNPMPPEDFNTSAKSISEIELKWKKNKSEDHVLVAWSLFPEFGYPAEGEEYVEGSEIPGGAKVIYNGSSNSFIHKGLKPDVKYYYKIWSKDIQKRYSSDLTATIETTFTHIWSGTISTDWYNPGNWQNGTLPVSISNVLIPQAAANQPLINASGAICNHILIEKGASLSIGNSTSIILSINGNWTNHGTFIPGTGTVEFIGANSLQTISGSSETPFYILKVDKGSLTGILEIVSIITLNGPINPLVLKSGKFKLSSASVLTPFTTSSGATITNGAGFWNNGGTINSGNFNWTLNGTGKGAELRMSGGIVNIGTSTGNSLIYLNNPSIIMEEGKLNIAARLQPNSSTSFGRYIQSGGTVNVFKIGSSSTTQAPIDFTSNMYFSMSGGEIVVQKASAHTTSDVIFTSASGNITGGTIQVGNEQTPENQTFRINSLLPFFNLKVGSPNSTLKIGSKSLSVINDLTIDSGRVVVGPGKQLSVFNTLKNNTGIAEALVIQSDSTGTGSVICSNAPGLATSEYFCKKGEWRLISAPLTGETISAFLQANSGIAVYSGTTRNMTDFNSETNSWNSLFLNDRKGIFETGKGYAVSASINIQLKSKGKINTGSFSVPVKAGAWNLVGNPYTSGIGINYSSMAVKNFIGLNTDKLDSSFQAIYFWNKSDSSKNQTENFAAISNDLSPVKEVPTGQAFFIKTSAKTDSIRFLPDMQIHSTTPVLKSEEFSWPEVVITLLNSGLTTSTRILFSNEMSTGLDPGYDVGIFKVAGENALYTKLLKDNGVDFAMQCIPFDGLESFVVPIGFDCPKGGEIEFSGKLKWIPQGIKVYIEDRLNKTIKQIGTGENLKTTVEAGSRSMGRFYLKFQPFLTYQPANRIFSEISVIGLQNRIVITGIDNSIKQTALYDLTGKLLFSKKVGGQNSETVNTSAFRPGIYVLRISGDDGAKGYKIRIF